MGLLAKYAGNPGLFSLKADSAGQGSGGRSGSFWGSPSLAGEFVTPQTALQLSAVWCANRILGETIGMLPLDMYERVGDEIRPAPKHGLQFYLHDEPNPEMSAMDWRLAMTCSLGLWGNAYAKIVRLRNRQIAGLWMLQPQLVNVDRNRSTGRREYTYYPPDGGGREVYTPDQVLHVRTMSADGLTGISPISQMRNAFGLAQALERYGSRFFANGAIPGVVLQYPGRLGDEAIRNIRESWKKLYGGADHANEVAVLEENMTANAIGTDPQKAQSLESRKFQILEVARVYRMPPHMLADLDRATFSNIEQQSLEFVTYTLMPWLTIWEQSISRSLLDPDEKGRVMAAFNVMDLLRGDIASRYAAYAMGRQWGWLSVNDIRRWERMNSIGPAGDVYLEPLNMIEVGANASEVQPGGQPANGRPVTPKPPAFIAPPKKMLSLIQYLNGYQGMAA